MRLFWIISLFVLAIRPTPVRSQEETDPLLLEQMAESQRSRQPEEDVVELDMEQIGMVIDLNIAGEEDLLRIGLIPPSLVMNLLEHRRKYGDLLSIYELQAIPGWEPEFIRGILPYITVKSNRKKLLSWKRWRTEGRHRLLLRFSRTLERNKGARENAFAGGPWAQLIRYQYQWQKQWQLGFTWEKDAGERKGFFSGHWQVRDYGPFRLLVIGDFTVSQGQGLVQGQGMRFGRGGDPVVIKRQGPVLRAYTSAGEVFFQRGIGIVAARKRVEWTGYLSYRTFAGNKTLGNQGEEVVSSIGTSGYYRTASEIEDRAAIKRWMGGGTWRYKQKNWQISFNSQAFHYSILLEPAEEPYRLFAFRGKRGASASVDMSGTFKGVHVFGETALNEQKKGAIIGGLLFNPDRKVDIGLLARHISPGYYSPESQAFTQQSTVQNERGLYISGRVRPREKWVVDLSMDIYHFPWLRYQVNGSSPGRDFQLQVLHTPKRGVEFMARYQRSTKWQNGDWGEGIAPLQEGVSRSFRVQVMVPIGETIRYRQRMEWVRVGEGRGGLVFLDFRVKPPFSTWSASLRAQWVGTDGYETRIYAFENDVLYASSLPAFYNNQLRYYLVFSKKAGKKIQLCFKFSQTLFTDKQSIGSSWLEITGNQRSDLRLQLTYAVI